MQRLIIDLEGTCPTADPETIEIGAVIIANGTRGGLELFNTFVRPESHPILTKFCTTLTSITQADVDGAPPFGIAFQQLLDWADGFTTFCGWGTYDRDQIARDCKRHGMVNPFESHVDLSRVFKKATGHKCGHRRAMRHLGLQPEGRQHRGEFDVLNIGRLAATMVDRGWL